MNIMSEINLTELAHRHFTHNKTSNKTRVHDITHNKAPMKQSNQSQDSIALPPNSPEQGNFYMKADHPNPAWPSHRRRLSRPGLCWPPGRLGSPAAAPATAAAAVAAAAFRSPKRSDCYE
jgi:hypothetical protein